MMKINIAKFFIKKPILSGISRLAAGICACAIFLMFVQGASAQSAEEFFRMGNRAFEKGDFSKAKSDYESAIRADIPTAELYYNLANTCSKLGKRGEAFLNYMRAVYEQPRLREAAANLGLFASDNSLELPQNVFAANFISELSESEWAAIAFVFFWTAMLLFFIPPLYGKKSAAYVFLAIVSACVFALSIIAVSNWTNFSNTAVAVVDDVPLSVSPVAGAPIGSIVSEGQTAAVLKRNGDYIYVVTPSGKRGWTPVSKFVPIAQ